MIKFASVFAVATVALTSAVVAAPFDPAYTSRDRQIEAQLLAAPAAEGSAYTSAFDPARNSSDDRAVSVRAIDETGAIATHNAPVSTYIPSMLDRFESSND
jgi:hypothetical protein